jgi:hypothetical protein
LLYDNGDTSGESHIGFAENGAAIGNTIDGVDKSGVGIWANDGDAVIFNNIITRCLDGIFFDDVADYADMNDYNLYYDNTDDHDGDDTMFAKGANAISADNPDFTGAPDYTLTGVSPCIAAGVDANIVEGQTSYMDIGAHQFASVGTLLMVNQNKFGYKRFHKIGLK